ncbi:fluoride efflux transporter CrcB [Chrysiogenes arsenatis]|uniref:fluoride efflux transporter CrcB n=1 Tax=Chrysiogenes arsenatis TaxID=309797 RepID=UPI000415A83C|nr:fluoride efflux transporter CrcB [Chrysiogenes arsenatis]
MLKVFSVAAGGALGALSRFYLGSLVTRLAGSAFPLGTLLINVSGSFFIGAIFIFFYDKGLVSNELRLAVAVGFLGAFTTFSTFSLETLVLWRDGLWGLAFLNILANIVLSLGACALGIWMARLILGNS